MQLIKNGPNIPEDLLQAHEEGKLIFFCGAGISYPAGLPDFKGLVKAIYANLYTDFYEDEKYNFEREQYDIVLNKLEKRIPGQRFALRKALKKSLMVTNNNSNDTQLHKALLKLSIQKDKSIKLITTNFDLLFEKAIQELKLSVNTTSAPNLPIIKKHRWDSLVYLHGKLPETEDEREYNNLVLTSGDFGLAYLYEGWAAQFLSNLFQNYYICFVGYSINDPIIRYMIDAMGADERQGEKIHKAWAFASYSDNDIFIERNGWVAKGVEPIFYNVSDNNHYLLYDTLNKWSEIYQHDIEGKKQIIDNEIQNSPNSYSEENDYIGRMLWALSEHSGNVMKYFVGKNPSFDWFTTFYNYKLEVSKKKLFKQSVDFILFESYVELKSLENNLLLWLENLLSDDNFFYFIIKQNKVINNTFKNHIRTKIYSKQYIIDPTLKNLWHLLTINKIKIFNLNSLWRYWYQNFQHSGLTTPLKLELQNLLSAQIVISKSADSNSSFKYEFVLVANDLSHDYHNKKPTDFIKLLPELFFILQQNLLELLEIQKTLTQQSMLYEYLYFLPSIEEHTQNKRHNNWTILIELLRDAWIEIYKQDKQKASHLAQNWFNFPYVIFKRLAFFAASYDETISPEQWLKWILSDNSIYLWSPITKREILRLIVKQSKYLSSDLLQVLENAILSYQPHDNNAISSDYEIWLRLKKLQLSISYTQRLSENARNTLMTLQEKNPSWSISDDQEEEFSIWIGEATWESNELMNISFNESDKIKLKEQLINIDKQSLEEHDKVINLWKTICQKDYDSSFKILQEIVIKNTWNYEIFETALWEWSQNTQYFLKNNELLNILLQMPTEIFKKLSYVITQYYLNFTKHISYNDDNLIITLLKKIIKSHCNDEFNPSTYIDILNHPLAIITSTIIQDIVIQQKFTEENKKLLKKLCNSKIISFRYARCILCVSCDQLYSINQPWAEKNILPLFDWKNEEEAIDLWKVIITHSQITYTLLPILKTSFIKCFHNLSVFKEVQEDLIMSLVYSLDKKIYELDELRQIIIKFSIENFVLFIRKIAVRQQEDIKPENFFENIFKPLWFKVIPKHNKYLSNDLTVQLIRICYWSGKKFPEAVMLFYDWLTPIYNTYDLCIIEEYPNNHKLYPKETLYLLNKVINKETYIYCKKDIIDCLSIIIETKPIFESENSYIFLKNILEQ